MSGKDRYQMSDIRYQEKQGQRKRLKNRYQVSEKEKNSWQHAAGSGQEKIDIRY